VVLVSDSPDTPPTPLGDETKVIAAGRARQGASLTPPLWATSTWETSGVDDTRRRATGMRPDEFYSRYANPTVTAFEEAIADLEGAERALAFASGMGALASTVLALCSAGDHVVAQRQLYAGTLAFLQGPCARFGIDLTLVDGTAPGAFAEAVIPGKTMVVVAETPSNPRLDLVDLDELGAIVGPFTLVDSTFATPLGVRPLEHGVDIVLHSATKGICGHNDATLGVIAGEEDLLHAVWTYGVLHGATPSPLDALNSLRGVRTLAVRVRQQCETALRLAEFFEAHPGVSAVFYPGLPSHPQYDLAKRQMRHPGTVLAVEVADSARVHAMVDALSIARSATSLGGPETLVCHSSSSTHVSLTDDEKRQIGITDGLLRVSVGLESADDLIADFDHALS
jgi:cystathionine beta-lyase/cystathionine gamma-synthase